MVFFGKKFFAPLIFKFFSLSLFLPSMGSQPSIFRLPVEIVQRIALVNEINPIKNRRIFPAFRKLRSTCSTLQRCLDADLDLLWQVRAPYGQPVCRAVGCLNMAMLVRNTHCV